MDYVDGIASKVLRFSELADCSLQIPDYQRPYVWGKEQIDRFINDLSSKEFNLLGSIILHKDNEVFSIVDGQQRLTTIRLILEVLKQFVLEINEFKFLENVTYFHDISRKNIRQNYKHIQSFISEKNAEKIFNNLKNSEFVVIFIDELESALVFFDNTNSKHLALEQHDLIKAFHLQSLEQTSSDIAYSQALYFEQLCEDEAGLKDFFNLCYWLRKHLRNDYSDCLLSAEFCKENLSNKSTFLSGVLADFASGFEFFQYLRKYYALYETIKHSRLVNQLEELPNEYLKNSVKMCLILYLDRFAAGHFNAVSRRIIRIIYSVRLIWQKVTAKQADEAANSILKAIFFSGYESELLQKLDALCKEAYESEKQWNDVVQVRETKTYLQIISGEFKDFQGHFNGE